MIKLTLVNGEPVYIRPESITAWFVSTASINHCTQIEMANGNEVLVRETPEAILALFQRPQE